MILSASVLGAGTMGAQIAAHLANVGIPVRLLDIPPDTLTPAEEAAGLGLRSPEVRNRIVRALFERMKKLSPSPFFTPEAARLVTLGNTGDDLAALADADWIVEAIPERLELKQDIHRRIAAHARPDALVTTNTSGLPIHQLVADLPEERRRRFFAAHFFNPPRYLRLLELVPTADTDPALLRAFTAFAEDTLGKGVVVAKDTPGFIGNRIGCHAIQSALTLALAEGLTVEETDALTGPAMGRPASGTFRLCDLVGIDIVAQIGANLAAMLPDPEDAARFRPPALLTGLIARGWCGEKTGRGFYQKSKPPAGRELHALDLATLAHRPALPAAFPSLAALAKTPDPAERLRALVADPGAPGRFAWRHLSDVLCYAADLIPGIADDPAAVDDAMRWGYNWELGPFEIWDALGVAATARRLADEGRPVPPLVRDLLAAGHTAFYARRDAQRLAYSPRVRAHAERVTSPLSLSLPLLHAAGRVVTRNTGASLLDLGDGVACLEFHGKMNVIGEEQLELLQTALDHVRRDFAGLVIGNQGPHFSAGANLRQFAAHIESGDWDAVGRMLLTFQTATSGLRAFEKPVVAACHGYTLGGGCEFALGCDHVVVHAELVMGLPETGVGLIPGAHGTKEMLIRWTEGIPPSPDPDHLAGVQLAWETLAKARLSSSAPDAARLRYLRPGESTLLLNRDHLLGEAKTKVLELARHYRPRPPRTDIPAIGRAGLATFKSTLHQMRLGGYITDHDCIVGARLAHVLCGGDLTGLHHVSEAYLMDLEREAFLGLCGEPKTLARIRHTLATGKPLRN